MRIRFNYLWTWARRKRNPQVKEAFTPPLGEQEPVPDNGGEPAPEEDPEIPWGGAAATGEAKEARNDIQDAAAKGREKDSGTNAGSGGYAFETTYPRELRYLDDLLRYRIRQVLDPDPVRREPGMPRFEEWNLPIRTFLLEDALGKMLSDDEARVLLIALAPYVVPQLIDNCISDELKGEHDFPRMGGVRGKNFRGVLPTIETAIFLLAGDDWQKGLEIQSLFWPENVLVRNKILLMPDTEDGEPALSSRIILTPDYAGLLAHGKVTSPHHGAQFPATPISTPRNRGHLVINEQLTQDFDHLLDWITHQKDVENKWEEGKKGYRCLFHGPPGTGKTFTACILGKETGRQVYRIDLSMIVSKFIGETEKNLELIFARAENKKWILFFDEADALFGKRTNIRDAHDKYANQEVSYLLQRIEDYDGLVILATNMKNNIDDAFLRRFDSELKFSMPNGNERMLIWQKSFPKNVEYSLQGPEELPGGSQARPALSEDEPERTPRRFYRYVPQSTESRRTGEAKDMPTGLLCDILEKVKSYPLSGANIQSVVHYATIRATKYQAEERQKRAGAQGPKTGQVSKGGKDDPQAGPPLTLRLTDLIQGIRREMTKNGIPIGHRPKKYKSK
jgi:hypothetical protein